MRKVKRKYCVGARDVMESDWPEETEAVAVEKAKELLDSDLTLDKAVVVKVVKVVRRGRVPYVVESV